MRKIEVQELSLETFRYFGSYHNLVDMTPLRKGEPRSNEFYPDLCMLSLGAGLPAAASVARVDKCEPVVAFAEIHKFTAEGILPLDGDAVIFVGKAGRGVDPAEIQAFRVPQGTFVSLLPGVVHGRQFVCGDKPVHVLILLPERTYANDCEFFRLEGENRVFISGLE